MYGLLGKTLKHSFSKEIHNAFGNNDYRLYETTDLKSFMQSTHLKGMNVTIPYKEEIVSYLDSLEGDALKTNTVNTVIRKNNKWIGYNTDYQGFKSLLSFYDVSVAYKKVLILGNGGSSRMVEAVCQELLASTIIKLCREPKRENEQAISNYQKYLDFDIIINTTPVGMYPDNDDELLFSIDSFQNLSAVIDLIYNPLQTKLLLAAKQKKVKSINGLYMLVKQASLSHELFFDTEVSDKLIKQTYRQIKKMMYNIILIGLPLSGKSKYARILSQTQNKGLVDTDASIELITNKSIPIIFQNEGESVFRQYEKNYIDSIYKSLNQVVSTGGGMVMDETIMMKLMQNGYIIYLDKNPDRIAHLTINNRPLINSAEDVYKLAKERTPLYKKYADYIVSIQYETEHHIKEIEEVLYEYISR